MKSILISIAITLMVILPDLVCCQESGYLFCFADQYRTTWCLSGTVPYSFEIWIWSFPSIEGQMGAEFNIAYPPNVIPDTLIVNENVVASYDGDLPGGLRVNLTDCNNDWIWLFKQTINVINDEKSNITFTGHPETGLVRISTCEEGYPFHTCWTCSLFVNYNGSEPECCVYESHTPCAQPVAVEGSSWGRIKRKYR